jgi:hypothetical protein
MGQTKESKGRIISHGQPESRYQLIEWKARSSVRYYNLIEWSLNVDDSRLRANGLVQSLHHYSVGYHSFHTSDLAMKAYPCKHNQNSSKNRKNATKTVLITSWGLTNQRTTILFDDKYDISKNSTIMWQRLMIK